MPSREIRALNMGSFWSILLDGEVLGREPSTVAAFHHVDALETWLKEEELDDETNKIPGIFRDN